MNGMNQCRHSWSVTDQKGSSVAARRSTCTDPVRPDGLELQYEAMRVRRGTIHAADHGPSVDTRLPTV